MNISGVGEMGVGEMGQIIGETGVGEMGVGETGTSLLFVLFKIIVTLVKDQVHNARNTILLRNDCNYEGKI